MNNNAVPSLNDIKTYIKNRLSEKRYNHSLAVAKYAKLLAKIHDEDMLNTETAGLLHDLAREWTYEEMNDFMIARKIKITDDEKAIPILLHGPVAAILIKEEFRITNIDIINSIKNHTLGAKNMSKMEKIVFLSDYMASAEGSDRFGITLDTAKKSLDKALLLTYESSYKYLSENNQPIADRFIESWNYYKDHQTEVKKNATT